MTTLSDRLFGTYLGIEFKDDSVILVYLRNSLSGLVLLSSSTFPLRDNDVVIDEVKGFIGQHGVNISRVFVSIPDRWAITKFTSIPSMKGKGKSTLANLMKFEIERHIPFHIDDVAYDFLLMDERDMTYSVVFVAVQKEKINLVRDFLDKLALQAHAITTSSFAVMNAIELSGISAGGWQEIIGIVRKSDNLGRKGESNVSLYVDKMNATLSLIRDGVCIHMKSFMLSASRSIEDLLDEIAGHLAGIRSEHEIDHFQKLMLIGEKSSVEEYTHQLKMKLSIKDVAFEKIEEFRGNIRGVDMNGLASSVGACFAGMGIGTYRVNLLPHKREYEVRNISPLSTKIFLILIVFLVFAVFAVDAVKQKRVLTEIEQILGKNAPEIKAIEQLTAEINAVHKRSRFLQEIRENEFTLEMLAELTAILPKSAWITNLDYKGVDAKNKKHSGGELIISGFAESSSNLIPILEDSPFFEKVTFVGTIKKANDKEQFKLSAQVVKAGAETPEKVDQ